MMNEEPVRHLLLIEDDSLVAGMLCTMLARFGFVCDHASSENEALNMFIASKENGRCYEFILVDLVLGTQKSGGVTVVQKIREIQPDVRAVLCSGLSSSPVVNNYHEYGFDFCLNKPFSWENLKTIIKEQFLNQSA